MYLSQDVEKMKNIVYVQISDDEKELIKKVLRKIFTKNLILPYQLIAIQENFYCLINQFTLFVLYVNLLKPKCLSFISIT